MQRARSAVSVLRSFPNLSPSSANVINSLVRVYIVHFVTKTMANLAFLVPVLLLAVFVRDGDSVRCWSCSSDLDPMCNDPFLAGRPETGYRFTLTNCDAHNGATYPYLTSSKSACKKHKKYTNGLLVVTRGCTWKRADDYSSTCPAVNTGNEVTTFCETCEYDGCNGASGIGMTIALLMAPLGLMLFK